MKIGIYYPEGLPFSACNYIKNIKYHIRCLNKDVFISKYIEKDFFLIKDLDILWDPRAMGGSSPYQKLINRNKPLVVTLHGVAPLAVPIKEYYEKLTKAFIERLVLTRELVKWRINQKYVEAVITVSKFAKKEIAEKISIDENKIVPIYHGVDNKVFNLKIIKKRKYFLHVSSYQPIKNVKRIIEAYSNLNLMNKPILKLILPGYNKEVKIKGIEIIRNKLSQKDLNDLYNEAIAFVFPSIRESFGMPILEAMACGCPVITSNVSACPEVAGDAALLVNPYSVEEIKEAMERIIEDKNLREELSEKGIERAKQFTWEKSARKHLEVFQKVVNGEI